MALWIVLGYLAAAAVFYFTLTVTAADASGLPASGRRRWRRTHNAEKVSLMRGLRSGLGLGKPKHTH